jgi:hypothetical protein
MAGEYGWKIYHFHVPIFKKYGSLSFLEPSGPLQVCVAGPNRRAV